MAPRSAALLLASGVALAVGAHHRRNVSCDVVVAGGSTASLAAALTAAEAAPELTVCFTEITDWPGGQMTAGGVPAIDFDGPNRLAANQPASFRDAMSSIPGNGLPPNRTHGSGCPGACSVSTKCYRPDTLVHEWIMPRLARSPNLLTFLRTAVVGADRDASTGRITSLTAVQRTPVAGAGAPLEWSQRLSDELPDWYSASDSHAFTKETLTLGDVRSIYIEATELGDVLSTAGLPWLQGVETPLENSSAVDAGCGQAATLTFYATLLPEGQPAPPPSPEHPALPAGNDAGLPFSTMSRAGFEHTWTWRRSYCAGNTSLAAVNVGDVSQQNLGNDLDSAYLLLPPAAARAQAAQLAQPAQPAESGQSAQSSAQATGWSGGVNLTALRMAEDRAYGWFSLMRNASATLYGQDWPARLDMDRAASGTRHGLSKMVYWRDTRRAIGVGGFKLLHTQLRDNGPGGIAREGTPFEDTVALGDYNDDCHHLKGVCQYPAYMEPPVVSEGGRPYFLPFRALMVGGAPNLLAAGKCMAESFRANSNTRLHPSEWTTGVAAGGAAALMARRGWRGTDEALTRITELRAFLNSSAVGQPLNWTAVPPLDEQVGAACVLGRCVGVDAADAATLTRAGVHVFPPTFPPQCAAACAPLADYEWLALDNQWTANTSVGSRIYSLETTFLKKSTAISSALPVSQKLKVLQGTPCILANTTKVGHYWLCVHHTHTH